MAFNSNDCELCNRRAYSRVSNGIKLCESCFSQTIRLRDGNDKEIRYFSNPANLMYASDSAKKYVRSFIPDWIDPHKAVLPDPNVVNFEKKEADLVISDSFSIDKPVMNPGALGGNTIGQNGDRTAEFEYEIVTVPVKSGASISNTEVAATLVKYSGMGWKLHTVLQNELSSAPAAALNVNISGSSEVVLIFERRK